MSGITFDGYGQNLAATITAALILGAVWVCKNKCKHSKCAIDTNCLQCSPDDIETIREDPQRRPPRRPSIERKPARPEGQIV